jgi:hypothetical protein
MASPMKRLITASAVLVSSCGGGGYTPPEPPSPRDATEVNASMGRTWDAVIDLFAARTIPIRTIERISGIIVTERLSVGREDGLAWADCGKTSGFGKKAIHISPNYAPYNVLVRGDSMHSSVKTTVRWVRLEPRELDLEGGGVYECSTKHVWERDLETGIKARAESPEVARRSSAGPTIEPRRTPGHSGLRVPAPPKSAGTTNPSSPPNGYAPPHTSAAGDRAPARANDELLAQPDFSRAIHDLQALQFLAGFQEIGADSLQVEVSDDAITTNLSEYNLGRLFSAYFRITNWNVRTTVLFTHSQQLIGTYTRSGLVIRQ